MLHFYVLVTTQIVTESLPISSSGHEILLSCLMHLLDSNLILSPLMCSDTISYFFNIPTVILVPIFFFNRWWPIVKAWRRTWRIFIKIACYAWVACAVTASLFLLIRSLTIRIPLWISFGITAVLLFSLAYAPPQASHEATPGTAERNKKLSVWYAIALGLVQGCAFFPGLSRLAAVYVVARWFGFNAQRAFEITWLVQWPLVVGASGVSMLMLYLNPTMSYFISPTLLCIMVVAAFVSYLCLGWTYRMALAHRLHWIAMYMIIPLLLSYWCAL